MTLFLMLLPLYLFGNIHCLGMCGPLVMMIGQHRYRYLYFIGRITSFTLAGLLAGELGAVLYLYLHQYYLAAILSIACGILIMGIGLNTLFSWFELSQTNNQWRWIGKLNQKISLLMLKDTGWSTFLFGFFTVALPCGQSLIVFSACALTGNALTGLFNGFALAFLTSPSLFLAMHARTLLKQLKNYTNTVIGFTSIAIGLLSCFRGFAEMGWIRHWILNPESSPSYHIVIF